MIKIFNANDRNFSTAGNIIIEPTKCREFKKKSLNGWYIEVEMPIKYKDYIEKDKLCVVKTKSKLNPQAFRIADNIQYTSKKISFTAEHVMFDASNYLLVDVRPTNSNGINTLNYINERTDNVSPFTMFSNIENVNTAYFIRKNLLEAWAIIEERWNGVFDADNWNISFLQSVGNDNGETIIYGKNMQSMEIFEDWSSVVTKLYPVGYDGLMLPEQYLESDVQYEIPYTRTIDFQTDLEQEEQTEENLINELRKNATEYIEENKYPKVSYTTVSNINDDMEIGDLIQVLHPLVSIKTEVLEYEYDIISEKIKSLTFGNFSRDVKAKFNNIKSSIDKISQVLSKQEITIKNQTDLINSLNKNGYVYIDDNEILILDKLPKEEAKNVWRFGLGGIGFSLNGYEGPFEIAITMDGQINANFITTGTMSVDRIESLANFITDTNEAISTIELQQNSIKTKVSSVETQVNNITNTQAQAEGKNIHIEDSAEEPFVDISLHGESTQEGTPTTDSPIEIENIEGNIEFKVEGKNKFDVQDTNNVTEGITVDNEGWITVTGDNTDGTATKYFNYYTNNLNLKTGTNFNVIAEVKNVSGTGNASFVSVNSSSQQFKTNFYRNFSVLANNTIYNSINETSDEFLGNTGLRTFISFSAGQSGSITFRISVLEDTTITPEKFDYEPYKSQVVYIPLTEGQKLMEGSYLADDGIHHTRKQYMFTGNEGFAKSIENDNYIRLYSPIFADAIKTSGYETIDKFICTHFEQVADYNSSKNCIALNNKRFYITISKAIVTDVTTFKTLLSEQYANGTPVIVEYELATEEIVPYTTAQQEAWNNIRALMTYKNVTNITSTAYAKVTYMRDNGLDVYETKQNAEKNYTETTKKLAEQKITVDGIVSEVSETKSNINTMNNNLTELNETVASTKLKVDEYEIKFEETTKMINEELKENSETIKSMSYTFNTDELSIAKSDDPVNAKINNSGMRVYSYNDLKAIFNDKGTGIQKLIVVGSAQLGNLQIVKATDENGEACTDFHHLVSNIQELTDLEV